MPMVPCDLYEYHSGRYPLSPGVSRGLSSLVKTTQPARARMVVKKVLGADRKVELHGDRWWVELIDEEAEKAREYFCKTVGVLEVEAADWKGETPDAEEG